MPQGARRRWIYYVYEMPLTVLIVTAMSFVLMRLSPVSPAKAYARRNTPYPTAENIALVTREMGLDQPVVTQYATWVRNAFQLNFGKSLLNGKDAWGEFVQMIPATLHIVGLSVGIQLAGIVALGALIYLAWGTKRGLLLRIAAIACLSIPGFYFASVYLELFAVRLGWIAVAGRAGPIAYIHPAICLAIPVIAFYGRLLGSLLRGEMAADYAVYARCRGLGEARIVWRHAMPRAFMALVPNFLQNIGFTIAGAAIVERIFSIPGIGYGIIDSVMNRDAPMIHLSVFFLGAVFVALNALADVGNHVLGANRTAAREGS